jgi:hypothetical protein
MSGSSRAYPEGTCSSVGMHAGGAGGYAAVMTDPLPDPIPDPDELPERGDSEPAPFEPSVTNPDADGIDDALS